MHQSAESTEDSLELACDHLARVSSQLDSSYRELQQRVIQLTAELAESRSARLKETAARELSLKRLASLISVLPGGVLLVNAQGIVIDANPEAFALLQRSVVGERWDDLQQHIDEMSSDMLAESRDRVRLSVVSRPIEHCGEHVVLITDTSELHDLQEQLGRKKRLTSLGEMAAGLAHQIRTPLASTTLYLSQLSREDLEPSQRAKISERMASRLSHMGGLLDSMLSFVRGEPPAVEQLYLQDILQELNAVVQPRLQQSQSSLSMTPVDKTLVVAGVKDDLVGALANLVLNAVEAKEEGSSKITVWAGAMSTTGLQLIVSDDGPGIDPTLLERVFDPFFTTRVKGTGLGLAVVAMTVSNHGGDIRARNHSDGGAEFIINLPLLTVSQ